jgi:hypothetical protein
LKALDAARRTVFVLGGGGKKKVCCVDVREPSAYAPCINVTYLVLVGLTCFSLPGLSAAVTTLEAEICPI